MTYRDTQGSDSQDSLRVTRPNLQTTRRVAVFGSGHSGLSTEDFDEIEDLGRRLARSGWTILSGGYGGVMQAISKGAFKAGGTVYAVTAEFRSGEYTSPYLSYEVRHGDLLSRSRYFIETADAYLVLPGGLGTLSELALTWNHLKTQGWSPNSAPLLLWKDPWQRVLLPLEESQGFWKPDRDILTWARGADDALEVLNSRVKIGQALRNYEDRTPSRRRSVEEYLWAESLDVRRTFNALEPTIWEAPSEIISRAQAFALAGRLLHRNPSELELLDQLPFERHGIGETEAWTNEFLGPERGPWTTAHRSRTLFVEGTEAILQEFESSYYAGDPVPLSESEQGDRVFRIANLEHAWVVTIQVEFGANVAASGASPRRSRELLEHVELVFDP